MKIVIAAAVTALSIFVSSSPSFASTDTYDSGRDHGCDDAGISDPSDRYINQPGKGPSFHTNEFMDGYNDGFYVCSSVTNNPDSDYPEYFLDENLSSSSDIDRDGNVTLGAECGMRALNDDQVYQQLSEHQCFYFNSCKNLGGSIPGCYESARTINCDIESGIRYNCPAVAMGSE
jgi:hypothetical protein